MDQLFVNTIQSAVNQGKVTAEKVSREKAVAAKVKEDEFKKAEAVAKEHRIMAVVGDLPKKIEQAAEKGLTYVDIRIDKADMVTDGRGGYSLATKVGCKTYEAYEFLKENIDGLVPRIYEDKKESTGAYGEREFYSDFYIRVTF